MQPLKLIANIIEKRPFLVILGVFLLPLILAGGMYITIFSFAKGEASGWLGFWGSYLGGLISGIFTFAAVYYAFNLQRKENKIKEILNNYADVFTVYKWCEDMLQYLNGDRKWDAEHVTEMSKNARDSYNVFISIDTDWYKRFQGIMANNFELISAINMYGFDKIMQEDHTAHIQAIEKIASELVKYMRIEN